MTDDKTMNESLIERLADARATGRALQAVPPGDVPADPAAAFDVQHALLARTGQAVGGWKVGAAGPGAPIHGAPLAAGGVLRSPAVLLFEAGCVPAGRVLGLELEIAFVLGRAFEPSARPWTDDEVLAAIGGMAATIEVVATRFAEGVDVPPLVALADGLFHGALAVGETVAYDAARVVAAPPLAWSIDGAPVATRPAANPAGDPRRLLPWLVNHATRRGLVLPRGTLVTTGSYIGLASAPAEAALVRGEIAGLPPVVLQLAGT